MAALYPNSNSIYIGDFGHGLTSPFQMHYIIGPSDFIEECKKWSSIYEKDFDSYLMETACALIREGEILRLEKKHRKIYRERRERMGEFTSQNIWKANSINHA
jgi:Transcriptional regulators containing a DNA-binding HTH domain and an aminotransferase domain (MocR family) and their eukaryotic orthologs